MQTLGQGCSNGYPPQALKGPDGHLHLWGGLNKGLLKTMHFPRYGFGRLKAINSLEPDQLPKSIKAKNPIHPSIQKDAS